MTNLQKWVEQYLTACKYQKALDTKTIKAYRIDLSQFSLFAGQGETNLTRSSMMEYISDLHQKYKPRTIRRKIASVKAFCGYLEYEELITENPFTKLQLKLNAPLILPRTIPFSVIEDILSTAYQQGQRERLSEKQQQTVLRDIAVGEPVFLTKNGRGRYAIVDMEEYEKTKAVIKLMGELSKGEQSAKEKGWTDISDVEKMLGIANG